MITYIIRYVSTALTHEEVFYRVSDSCPKSELDALKAYIWDRIALGAVITGVYKEVTASFLKNEG
jgi:hypothetical protein